MKTLATTMAACLVGLSAVYGQQDTVNVDRVRTPTPLQRPEPVLPNSTVPALNEQSVDYNNVSPLIRIRIDEVPADLRKTLKQQQYSGWEKAMLYRHRKTNEYSIDIRSGDSLRTFRFDRFGKPVHPDSPLNDDQ